MTDAPAANAQAKAVFDQHHDEIQRRKSAAHSETVNASSFPRAKNDTTTDLPFVLPDQEFVLYSVSHVRMPPVCENCMEPAIRLYGTFSDAEAAKDHARIVARDDPSTNLQLSRTHEWFCMAASVERLQDQEGMRDHVRRVQEAHSAARVEASSEFSANVAKREGGKGASPDAQAIAHSRAKRAADAAQKMEPVALTSLTRAARISRAAEVRDQSYLVVAFLADCIQDLPEPLVCVYGAFHSQEEADVYCRNTAGEEVKDHDLYVVSACEWLFPQNIDPQKLRSEVFRSAELSSVIANHKSQPNQVENYKRWRDSTAPKEPGAAPAAASDGAASTSALPAPTAEAPAAAPAVALS